MGKNKFYIVVLFSICLTAFHPGLKPEIQVLEKGTSTSLRGLSVVNDNIVWVSGSNGKVGKSVNGGKNWTWFTVKGFEQTDFRDIEAFSASTAIIMGISSPAHILKTTDGGETWKVVYENKHPDMFLDAMDFASPTYGMAVGDPINGKAFLIETTDGGNSWKEIDSNNSPALEKGEAFFAASGSNIKLFNNGQFFLVSGGSHSHLFSKNKKKPIPLLQGKETTGANAIDFFDDGIPDKPGKRIVIVGGDFADKENKKDNCIYSNNGGKSWKKSKIPPQGYRSSVEYISQYEILAAGLTGVDYTKSGGKTWKWISQEEFHVVKKARTGSAIFLAGRDGKIGRAIWK